MRSTDQTMNAVRHAARTNLGRDKDRHGDMIIAETIELSRIIDKKREREVTSAIRDVNQLLLSLRTC